MNPDPDNQPEPELPPKLAEALRSLSRPRIVVPSSIDEAITKAAADHLLREGGRATAPAEPPVGSTNNEAATHGTPWRPRVAGAASLDGVRAQAARRAPSPYRYWLAAAAALVLGLFLIRPWERSDRQDLRADLDRSGRVDVLDAFLLARKLAAGTAGPEFDLNGDGRVDQRDVDFAVNQAVRLPTGI
jgi:hypothetical protein